MENKGVLEKRLDVLRDEWIQHPEKRKIIEMQAKYIKLRIEGKKKHDTN